MDRVIEQLLDFCECIKDFGREEEEHQIRLRRNVEELIRLISILTCWTQVPCETFLNSRRTEYMDVRDIKRCSCEGGIIEFSPFYYPFNPLSVKIWLIKIDGVNEELIEVSEEDFNYIDSLGKIRIDLVDYVRYDKCSCKSTYKLKIEYDAGFDEIPDCLLKLFCDLLHIIYAKNDCTCDHCQACNPGSTDTLLEFDPKDDESISPRIEYYLNTTLYNAYINQLALISICGRSQVDQRIWGVVV